MSVLLAGNLLWGAVLAPLNLRVFPAASAIVPMAAYPWIYWKFIGGAIGSPQTAVRRREWLRANTRPSEDGRWRCCRG